MKKVDIDYINTKLLEENSKPIVLVRDTYPEVISNGNKLINEEGKEVGTKGDMYTKKILDRILEEGTMDINPRPHYEDGTKAHTLSVNHGMCTYDISKGEFPITTLRPIAVKSSIGEILWIYQDASNNLDILRDKYNVKWWDSWDIGNRTIGTVYGETVKRHQLMSTLLEDLKNNPDGRRHMIDLWQVDDFKEKHGLKPCAFLSIWNVRHGRDDKDYLDMMLVQRSSDFATAGNINQIQYLVLQHMVARHVGMEVGRFTWTYDNIQIYDRHINQAIEMLNRKPIDCEPKIWLNPEKKNFYDFTLDDIKIVDYPMQEVKEKNKQLKFPIGI